MNNMPSLNTNALPSTKWSKASETKNNSRKTQRPTHVAMEQPAHLVPNKLDATLKFRKNRKSKRIQKAKYDHQASWTEKLASLPGGIALASELQSGAFLDKFETLSLLLLGLKEAQSKIAVTVCIAQALKNFTKKSLTSDLMDVLLPYCQNVFGFNVFEAQDSEESLPNWLSQLKCLETSWETVKQFEGFGKISKLISMIAAIGLCDLSNFDFTLNGVKLFSVGAHHKHVKATDLFGALIDTVVYFAEGAYKCFITGSLEPFIYTHEAAKEFEKKFTQVTEIFVHAKSSNLSKYEVEWGDEKKILSDNDFSGVLDDIIDMAQTIANGTSSSWERNVLTSRLVTLKKMRADWQSLRVNGELREAPFGVYIHGKSAVGKSTVSALIMRCVLSACGCDCSDNRIVAIKEADKYDSNLTSSINGFFIDDLGNTKPDFVEKSPCEKLIDIMNNMPTYANMAEADMKGKVSIAPKCVVGTSNVRLADLARKYSMEPYSIVRRMHYHLTVTVKPEFCVSAQDPVLDSSKIFAKYGDTDILIPDCWNITISKPHEASHPSMLTRVGTFSIADTIKFLNARAKEHFQYQSYIVKANSNLGERLQFNEDGIPACILDKQADWDSFDDEVSVSSEEDRLMDVAQTAREAMPTWRTRLGLVRKTVSNGYEDAVDYLQSLDQGNWYWLNYLPDCCLDNIWFQRVYCLANYGDVRRNLEYVKHFGYMHLLFAAIVCVFYPSWTFVSVSSLWIVPLIYFCILAHHKYVCQERLAKAKSFTPELFTLLRRKDVQYVCGVSAVFAVLYTVLQRYRAVRQLAAQADLRADSWEQVKERDAEVNPWANAVAQPLHVSERSKRISFQQLEPLIGQSTFHATIVQDTKNVESEIFMIEGNIGVMPKHTASKIVEAKALLVRKNVEEMNSSYEVYLSSKYIVPVVGTDLALIYIPSVPASRNLSVYLPHEHVPSTSGILFYRNNIGFLQKSKLYARYGRNTTSAGSFTGHEYSLEFDTFNGLCAAPILGNLRYPVLMGFHLGGISQTKRGCSGSMTLPMYEAARKILQSRPGIVGPVSTGNMPTTKYDVQFYEGPTVHPKSPVNFLEADATVEHYGSVTGRVNMTKSSVVTTCISPIVTAVTGEPLAHGPPMFHRWKNWYDTIKYSGKPSAGVEGNLLTRAVEDYLEPLVPLLKRSDLGWRETVRPLTRMQTVCGVDGERFIDKMPPNTSVGYPLNKPKKDFLVYVDPDEHKEFACPAELDERFWQEAERMKECYRKGERAYPIFKACLKDEPTKIGKEKVRVFQAAEMAAQLLLRQYFLPIMRFISMNPFISECAVGINAHGPEWAQMIEHVTTFGKERILAGDYSKYDIRMPAQLILASFDVFITLAEVSGNYSEDDLMIMRGLAVDNAYPCSAFNGDLLMFNGTVPSGTNLTVYINNTCNGLLHRCGFYDITGDFSLKYREYVKSLYYGDDAFSSVSEKRNDFNHISYAQFLKKHDIVFTMPDKESEPTEYMSLKDVDFLKRKDNFIPEIGISLGALDEKSIFKSLHAVLQSSAISREDQAAQNIDGALREWFAHGRDVYEFRRRQMQEIAIRGEVDHICRELEVTFDERVKAYKEKYFKPSPEPSGDV